MGIDREYARGSASVVEEVEAELQRLLDRKREDLERAAARFRQQERAVPRGLEESEGERPAFPDGRAQPAGPDTEFKSLLDEIRDRFRRVLHCQTEIEKLTRLTTEEITRVFELLGKAAELRTRLLEERRPVQPAPFEVPRPALEPIEPDEEILPPDLKQALERVRKIKDLLGVEMGKKRDLERVSPGPPEAPPVEDRQPEPLLPGIQDLVAEPAVVPPATAETAPEAERPEPAPPPDLDAFRRAEPASARGEVYYFQKGRKIILDTARILEAAEKSRAEAKRLILKLGQTEATADQFALRQGIVSWQEGFRRIVLQVVKMNEKNRLDFPELTADALNSGVFKDLLERLSLSDWSRPEDFAAFERWLAELRERIGARTPSTDSYRSSLLSQLDED
jgi:hypothetical protein